MIDSIAGKLQGNWQTLALKLGFQDDEIEYYETSYPDTKTQTVQMLTVWMERDGSLPVFTKVLNREGLLKSVHALIVS